MTEMKENSTGQKLRVCSSISSSRPANTPFGRMNIPLTRSDGMIGVCPVFDDYNKAVEYMNGNKEDIREMTITYVNKSEK